MKYTIEGFAQKELIAGGLDCRDAVFLRWFVDFQAVDAMKRRTEDEKTYYWLDHAYVIEQLPILGRTSPDTFRHYLRDLLEKRVLEKITVRRGKDSGTAVYYRINPDLMKRLLTDPDDAKDAEHRNKRSGATPEQKVRSDSSISDSSSTKKKGGAEHLGTSGAPSDLEEPTAPPPPPPKQSLPDPVRYVEDRCKAHAPSFQIGNPATDRYIQRFDTRFGRTELVKVIDAYLGEKSARQLKYVDTDLPERLTDAAKQLESKPVGGDDYQPCADCRTATIAATMLTWTDEDRERQLCPTCYRQRIKAADPDGAIAAACFADIKALLGAPAEDRHEKQRAELHAVSA